VLQTGILASLDIDIQVILVLRNFALTRLENLHHFLNLHDNFQFNAVWHRRSVVVLIFCRRLAGSDGHCHALSKVYGLITLVI
jgi:hypothetical protein